jgi:hypothetical protein
MAPRMKWGIAAAALAGAMLAGCAYGPYYAYDDGYYYRDYPTYGYYRDYPSYGYYGYGPYVAPSVSLGFSYYRRHG